MIRERSQGQIELLIKAAHVFTPPPFVGVFDRQIANRMKKTPEEGVEKKDATRNLFRYE